MTVTAEVQAVVPVHKWPGIASSVIGVASVAITLLLVWIAMSGTEPSGSMKTALSVFSSTMLCANLSGTALGFWGVKDHQSRKLCPLLGLALNGANLMTFVTLAVVGLSMNTH